MNNINIQKYKLQKESLMFVQDNQLSLFEEEFTKFGRKKFITVDYEHRGYSVNDKRDTIIDSKVQTISFFSGAGGLDIGAQLAGSKVISSLDFDKDSVSTMKQNKFFKHAEHFHKDIQSVTAAMYSNILKKNNPEKLILIGGPPCQPFSKAGYWVTHKNRLGSEDPRNMIGQYLRIAGELRPDGFILENVESLLHPKNENAVKEIEEAVDKLGYKLSIYKTNAIEFGVPQKRKRVFFMATRNSATSEPLRTHGSDQEILVDKYLKPYEKVIDWIGRYDKPDFFENEELVLGKTYENELRQVPPGQNYFALTTRSGHPDPKFEANKRFWNFLLKLHPNLPSWTIAAQPGPWVGPFHWDNRRLRVPEISAIQTFPEDYIFAGSRRSIHKQIGNAVPSLLGKAIVEHLIRNI